MILGLCSLQAAVDSSINKDAPDNSETKTLGNVNRKRLAPLKTILCIFACVSQGILICLCMWLFPSRTRSSPKKSAKKLFLDGDTMDDNRDGRVDDGAAAAETRYLLAFVYDCVLFSCCMGSSW